MRTDGRTQRQTDRQTDTHTQTDRQTGRHTHRQTDRHTDVMKLVVTFSDFANAPKNARCKIKFFRPEDGGRC
jgi:hypothetical protein